MKKEDILALAKWDPKAEPDTEIAFHPARVLMQDFTGVPAVVDLAAMREAIVAMGGDPAQVNPLSPVDLVIDHSVQVDNFASSLAFGQNVDLEYERNRERYEFLRWGQSAFKNFRVVPPGTGICPPGEPRVPREGRLDERARRRRLSRHARRHRLAHDDDQRPRRPRLGRRRDRGRGRHARPAHLDAHPRGRRLEAHRQAARGRDRDGPRPHRHPDAPQEGGRREVRRVLRARPRGAPARRTARRSRTWRPSTARRWASSRSTARRSSTSSSPAGRRSRRSSRPTARRRGSGAPRTPPSRASPTRSSWTSPTSCPSLAGPKRPQDRIALKDAQEGLPRAAPGDARQGRGRPTRPSPSSRGA